MNPILQSGPLDQKIELIGSGDGTEIVQYEIPKGRIFVIDPSVINNTYEFYYVVYGKLENNNNIYKKGTHIEALNISSCLTFQALEDTLIIMFVSRMGEYKIVSDFNTKLLDQLDQIEKKDNYTFSHCRRVEELCFKVGKELNLDANKLRRLILAACFHDIGKIEISDYILNKPGPLNDEEYVIMKTHVKYSKKILERNLDPEIAGIVIQHHERINGSGYPYKLKGSEILFEAKILAVIDSYDAMVNDRVYKKAMCSTVAIKELISMCPSYYDLSVVTALIKVLENHSSLTSVS
jgi:putative nucleotidyltransferase with HDIG domain